MNERRESDPHFVRLSHQLADHGEEARIGTATLLESIRVEHAELRASLKTLAETVEKFTVLAAKTDTDFRQAMWFARGAFAVVSASIVFIGWFLAEKNAQIQATQKAVIEVSGVMLSMKDEIRRQDEVDREMLRSIMTLMKERNR